MVDLISELPDPIFHHVMSFLPTTDAAKISALSKRFRSAWYSFPIIVFDEKYFSKLGLMNSTAHFWWSKHRSEVLLNSLHHSLMRRLSASPDLISLDKFVFRVTLKNKVDDDRVNRAIGIAIDNNVKDLDLDVDPRGNSLGDYFDPEDKHHLDYFSFYMVPMEIFKSKSVKVLKLKGFEVDPSISNSMIPFVENLSFNRCKGPERLKISGSRLRSLELNHIYGSKNIVIEASNLEFISYTNYLKISWIDEEPHIEQCDINIASCKSLKYLSLTGAGQITDEWLTSHLLEFPQLETLKLSGCNQVESIYVNSSNTNNLKTIELDNCAGLKCININTLNLESFMYRAESRSSSCEIDIRACRFLKSLKLDGAKVSDQWLEDNVLQFPFLENLILTACNLLKKIKISDNHEGLKSFQLLACTKLEEAEIHARNLCSFTYQGDLLPTNLLINSSFLDANLFLDTKLNPPKNEWFERLRDFLGFFDHCKILRLVCKSKILLIPKEIRESLLPPLFDVKHLKVETSSSMESLKMLVESLLWLSPLPETISIVSGNKEKLLKFQYAKAPVAEEDYQICCRDRLIKCWKHYVNIVTMENFDDLEEKLLSSFFFVKNTMRLESICYNRTPSG